MMMITSAFIPLLLCSGSVGGVPQDKELSNALVFGADAALNVYVHDEMNKPITGACVRCGFWLQTSKSSKAVYGQTDATGHFLAKAKCNDDVLILAKSKDYYWSSARKRMIEITTEPKVKEGKWQPYGIEVPVCLRRINAPISMERHFVSNEISIPATNQWIGFDMKKESFVKPFGDGDRVDFELKFDWDGKVRKQYSGSTLRLRFKDQYAGGYWSPLNDESYFKTPMLADTNANYSAEFEFFTRRTGKSWVKNLFGKDRSMVFRTRCRADESGRLKESVYGQMYGLTFGWGSEGRGWFMISYELNPNLNDPNLESDVVKKNADSSEELQQW